MPDGIPSTVKEASININAKMNAGVIKIHYAQNLAKTVIKNAV